jgi:hypothetical protein
MQWIILNPEYEMINSSQQQKSKIFILDHVHLFYIRDLILSRSAWILVTETGSLILKLEFGILPNEVR